MRTKLAASDFIVRRGSTKDLAKAGLTQNPVRRQIGRLLRTPSGAIDRGTLRAVINQRINEGTTAGTHQPASFRTGGKKILWIHKDLKSAGVGGITRRGIVAHEAFHSRTPILGRSELLAHAYGGWHSRRGAGIGERLKDAGGQIAHAFKTRPETVRKELAIAGGTALGGYLAYRMLRSKLKQKLKEHREARDSKGRTYGLS